MNEITVFFGQSKCKRCGRWFKPKGPGQKYGPKCGKKVQGQTSIVEVRNKQGELTAVIV